MARITNEQADKYYSGGSSEWFQLKNDGDVARVQFMFDSIEDIPTFSTHRIKIGDKERQVDCLRMPGDPIEKCPLCEAGIPARAARFVIMYQLDDQKVKIWERGRQFISKLQGLINRYSPLSEHVFEIERHGRAGDLRRVDVCDLAPALLCRANAGSAQRVVPVGCCCASAAVRVSSVSPKPKPSSASGHH